MAIEGERCVLNSHAQLPTFPYDDWLDQPLGHSDRGAALTCSSDSGDTALRHEQGGGHAE